MAKPTPTMVSVERARTLMLAGVRRLPVESVAITELQAGTQRVLAQALCARWALPNADLSVMDGFAVRSADMLAAQASGELVLLAQDAESAAGHPTQVELSPGHALAISTGAVMPRAADMVVPVEDTSREGKHLRIAADAIERARAGRFVRALGSEVQPEALLLDAATPVGASELALLAAAGHVDLPLYAAPRVAVISTGDELVPPGASPAPGQVVSTNALMLAHQLQDCGAEYVGTFAARDTLAATREAFSQAFASADLVVSTGGLSMGVHDHVWPALLEIGAKPVFRKTTLRPGKPTSFASVPDANLRAQGALCLPGNPASAYVAFELFGRPYLHALAGRRILGLPRVKVRLGASLLAEARRDHYVRARISGGLAYPLATQVSGALPSIANAQLLIILPSAAGELPAGTELDALRLPGAQL